MFFQRMIVAAVVTAAVSGRASSQEAEAASTSIGKQYEGIVRIENSAIAVDYRTPWNGGRPSGGSGTGFLIGPNKFLTNAHVVSNASRLIIKRINDAKPHLAKIEFIAHDCDLAILSVIDATAFDTIKPLVISDDIPKLDTTVAAVGYPIGGERISVTRGVVSRVDFRSYSHSGADQHLTVQVDAAINPGNSGGPVLQGGKVVGVAFQGYSGATAQNTGYIIPTPVVNRFLKDISDGSYDHYADLAASDFQLENPAMRRALGLTENGLGVMITNVESAGSSGDGLLKRHDVLLAIDGMDIASDGFIELAGERVNMNEVIERKFAGDKIKLKVWRERKEIEVELTLKRLTSYLMQANQYEKRPEFAVYAGLVFQPLDRNLMNSFSLQDDDVRYFFTYYQSEELYKDHPQVVILTQVLADAINTHVEGLAGRVVEEINGTPIKTMKDIMESLKKDDGDFATIKLMGEGRPIVLDRKKVAAAQTRINKQYGVKEDHFIEE